ncbi:MAG: hypothetical protein JWQ71_421 [Pedosphaera sp.]|nr:hypothetical protein [Pedosphaera sp.]
MRSIIQAQLASTLPPRLVEELLEAHAEAKRNLYLGGLRLSEVEGGRFCEAAFRLLEQITQGSFTPLGTQLNTEKIIQQLENLPKASHPDAIRIHIPRALRLVYDIRNKRDAAHLADGIDPNLQDATMVSSVLDWTLAEFIRLYHNVTAGAAQQLVAQIVTRAVPVVQDFNGFPKVLKPNLAVSDHCLVLLYQRGGQGATFKEMETWVRPQMRPNLGRTLTSLGERKDLIHFDGTRYLITYLGQQEVEARHLVEPIS